MNACSEHASHAKKTVKINGLELTVYDWEQYKNVTGYCTGKDDVSRTLLNGELWHKESHDEVLSILNGEGIVLDFGAHIGWYSVLAGIKGHQVYAYEGDNENARVLEHNAEVNCPGKVTVRPYWVDDDSVPLHITQDIKLLKSDLEGQDHNAVRMCDKLFREKRIEFAYIEVSPVLNEAHNILIETIEDYGYKIRAEYGDRERQADVLFERT